MISNWYCQFFATSAALIMLCGLFYQLQCLLVCMQQGIQLLVQPDSLRLETFWFIIVQSKPVVTWHWCLAPKHELVWLKAS